MANDAGEGEGERLAAPQPRPEFEPEERDPEEEQSQRADDDAAHERAAIGAGLNPRLERQLRQHSDAQPERRKEEIG